MVVTNETLDVAEQDSLNYFNDNWPYIGVGTGSGAFSDSQTTLVTELYRSLLEDKNLNLSEKYVIFAIRVPATQSDGNTIVEVAIFDALTGGNMGTRDVVVGSLSNLEEYWIDVMIQAQAENV